MKVFRKLAEWTGYATFLVFGLAMLVVTLDSDQEETQAKSEIKPAPVETATLGPDEPPEPVPVEASAPTVQSTVNVDELSCPEPVKVNLDYAKAVPVRQIASDIVNQWGLKVGALDVLPKGKSRDFFWVLSTERALTVLARGDDWTWYRNGDTVRFVKRDDPVLTTTAKLIATKFKI